ncbi:dipeptide transport system permease protein DppB [Lachnospiraceae bacterium KM106-2]|nr:dipeptide transport system permease protein DppB [Lachnospiraceae bacterium KM106-2]
MKYGIKKIVTLIITLLLASFLTFVAFDIIPGDSALSSLGMDASEEQVEALREEMGFNDPIYQRYARFIGGVVTGDFGTSTQYHMPVKQLVTERFPVTIGIAVISILLILFCSVPIAIISAKREGSTLDRIITFLNQLGMSIPPFFLGLILTLVFGILLKWFVPGQYIRMEESFAGYVSCLLFPAIAVAIPKIAMMVKFLRSSVIRQLDMDYVRTAKSKGNSERGILYKHVLKNALIPVITFFAMIIADVLAGSIIVEQVFNLPGLGRLLVVSISARDLACVQIIVLYITAVVLVLNCIVDILYQYVDPRINLEA